MLRTLLTFADVIGEIARVTGRDIRYLSITPEDYRAALLQAEVPGNVIELVLFLFGTVPDGRKTPVTDDVRRALGRAPRELHRVRAAHRRERRVGRLMVDKTPLAIGLVFVAAVGSGIVAGIFFAFSSFVMAALERIPPVQGIAAMNSINVTVINPSFMSVLRHRSSVPSRECPLALPMGPGRG
jgi:hypothetical protein